MQQRSKYGLSDEQTDQLMTEEIEQEVSYNISTFSVLLVLLIILLRNMHLKKVHHFI